MVVTEWERYKPDRAQMNTKSKQLLTLKANNKKATEDAEETINRMKYGSQMATKRN